MKRLKIAALLGVFCFCGTVFGQEKSFTLIGSISGEVPEYIRLYHIFSRGVKDSAKVVNNEFKFTGSLDKEFENIRFGVGPICHMPFEGLFLENDEIHVSLDIKIVKNATYDSYLIRFTGLKGGITEGLYVEIYQFIRDNVKEEFFLELLEAKMKSMIIKNPNHPVFLHLIVEFMKAPNMSSDQALSLFNLMDTSTMPTKFLEWFQNSIESKRKFEMDNKKG